MLPINKTLPEQMQGKRRWPSGRQKHPSRPIRRQAPRITQIKTHEFSPKNKPFFGGNAFFLYIYARLKHESWRKSLEERKKPPC